jgi:DNA-binding CsgD family transcriptional regulator
VPGATREQTLRILGREAELAVVERFADPAEPGRGLFLTGEPGAGKTTLWEAGVELAGGHDAHVLSARASGTETQLAFSALIDLLEGVDGERLGVLPVPQRRALEIALLRAEPTADALPDGAAAVGFTNVVRALSAERPVVMAVDDVHALDPASAQALAFAVRRLDEHEVRFLFARRSRTSSFLERAHGPKGLQRLEVGPLSFGAVQRLLADRLGLSLPRHTLRRVVDGTLGNPLFALELGRMLAAREPLAIGEDVPLPDLVQELLGLRIAQLSEGVRRLLLAVALSSELRVSQLEVVGATPAVLDEALESGVLTVETERLRPAHPLFAAAAKRTGKATEQRELHRALAEVAADKESRAIHRALAAEGPDDAVAEGVSAAAAAAARRGARHDAIMLAEHALRLTPAGSGARTARVLVLGGYLAAAGERRRITSLLNAELPALPAGAARVRASLLLTFGAVADNAEIRRHMDDALRESAGDAVLRASVLTEIAENEAVIRVHDIPTADEWAREALAVVESAATVETSVLRHSIYALAWTSALRGQPVDELCERFHAASDEVPFVASSPERVAGQRLTWRGETEHARTLLDRLLALADENGESHSYALLRLHICQLEMRVGNCEAAARLLDEWAASREQVMWPMYERCQALLAAVRGLPSDAESWAVNTLERAEATGAGWDQLEALRARGVAALLGHDPARAAQTLRAVWEHTCHEGVEEPGVFPVAPELVEALAELGETDEATAVTDRLQALADRQRHPWALASAARCRSLAALGRGDDLDAAGAELADAAAQYAALGLRFDHARSLLSLGRSQRRSRKWGAARDSLEQAAAGFDELGCQGWAEEARAEHARVGGRRPRNEDELTPAEQRVVELAVDGLTNKEIARELVVTVRTVEVHLKHAYAKLGVRSRAQLARRLSERP